jgi:hypothetical protein
MCFELEIIKYILLVATLKPINSIKWRFYKDERYREINLNKTLIFNTQVFFKIDMIPKNLWV